MQNEDNGIYAAFFRKSPEMLFISELDGRFKEVNPAIEQAIGFTPAEMVGKLPADFVHPEDLAATEAAIKRVLSGESRVSIEVRALCKDGSYKWLRLHGAPDTEKKLLHVSATDITARKMTEAALRESADTLRKILDLAPMSMAIVSMDGTIEYINQKAVQTFGYLHEDIPTMDRWWAQAYPDEAYRRDVVSRFMGNVQEAIEKNGEIAGEEYVPTCKDGAKKTCFIYGAIAAGKVFVMFDDITRRVEAERALRDSEASLRKILDSAPMAMAIHDKAGNVEYVNKKFTQVFGYEQADIPNKELWALRVAPDAAYRAEIVARWGGFLKKARESNGEIEGAEYSIVCKDGKARTVFIFGVLAAGKAVIMFDDITLRIEAEKAVRESERTLRRILEQAPISIAIHEVSGNMEFVNSKFTETFGYRLEDISTVERWTQQAYPEEGYRRELLARWEQLIEKALRTTGEIEGGEYRVVAKGGAVRTVRIYGMVTADKKVVSLLDDVTSRVEAEKGLRESESRYRALVETTRTGYVIINKEGRVIDANTEYVRLTGRRDLKEVQGKSVLDWTADYEKEKNAAAVAQCAQDGYIWDLAVDYAGPSGDIIPVEISATVIQRGGVPQIMTLCRDITVRRRTEEQIKSLNHSLEKRVEERTLALTSANQELMAEISQRLKAESARNKLQEELLQSQKLEAVGRLAGGIAHDFNNILGSISGYAEFLLDTMPQGAQARVDLAEIMLETEKGSALTHQLLTFSSRQEVRLEVMDINKVACDSEKMLKRLIGANMHLEARLDERLWSIKADPSQLAQVIMNLVINARDAMPEGGRIIMETRNTELGADGPKMRLCPQPGRYAELCVSDTGCGMAPEVMERMFEPFFTTKKAGQGTGLGLATVYGIISRAGGGISVDSAPGQGTRFKVYLPRVDPL